MGRLHRVPGLLLLIAGSACWSCGGNEKQPSAGPGAPLFDKRTPDETLVAPGLKTRVEIARDELGIPHIFAHTLEDASYAQGYMHARDRFFQIDALRHLVEGRLSEYFGQITFDTDVGNRSFMMTTDGRPVFEVMAEQMTDKEKSVLDAYSAGINLYIAALKAGTVPVPAGYQNSLLASFTPDMVPEWRPADTLALGRLQEQNLSDSTDEDIARGLAKTALPPDLFTDLVRYAPPDPIAILPDFYTSPYYGKNGCTTISGCTPSKKSSGATARLYKGVDFRRTARALRAADPFGMNDMPVGVEGSNNWVVAGEHTETGSALVLNDPHLRFYNPPLFYHGQIDTRHYGTDTDASSVMGISFPGIAGILIGHNENVAWGATTTGYDVSDVYVETLNAAGDATLFNGQYVPLRRVTVPIGVFGSGGLTQTNQVFEIVPHHGVIIPSSKANGKALTRKWTGQEPFSSFGPLIDRLHARNIDDFMEAMAHFVVGAQNWNGADTAGNTGYIPGARIPIRANVTSCDPTIPMDGSGSCEWTGIIPLTEVPRVKNRSNGYVVTANNDVTGTLSDNDPRNDPQYLHSSNADGFRARRITDRVEDAIGKGKVTREQMVALQADTVSLEAKRLMPFILAARDADPALVSSLGIGDALSRLAAWDFSNPSGVAADYRKDGGPSDAEIQASIAAAIYNTFRPRLLKAVFADEEAKYNVTFDEHAALLYLLENQATSRTKLQVFDDITTPSIVETPNRIILTSLGSAVEFLKTKLGPDPNQWRWGSIHQVEIQDVFGQFGISFHTLGPYPRGGTVSTVDVADSGDSVDAFHFFSGPQMRFVAEVGANGIVAANSLPGGEVEDPQSKHYADLLPLWLRNETFPYYFKPADVVAHAEELIVLKPQ